MTIRQSLLALLATEPTHGYGLKTHFEAHTAGAWPLNIGQVYTTLARLERDGLVEPVPAEDDGPRQTWRITGPGQAALASWFAAPIALDPPARDELAVKVLLAVAADRHDVLAILDRQRAATLDQLQRWTRQKAEADPERELPWLLVLDALVLRAEAELAWLARCEARLAARRRG